MQQKSLLCGKDKIDAKNCRSLSELSYIKNLQTCQSENCRYFFTQQRCCYMGFIFMLWSFIMRRFIT